MLMMPSRYQLYFCLIFFNVVSFLFFIFILVNFISLYFQVMLLIILSIYF